MKSEGILSSFFPLDMKAQIYQKIHPWIACATITSQKGDAFDRLKTF
jgi:hypothetical protein